MIPFATLRLAILSWLVAASAAQAQAVNAGPFVPTPWPIVAEMLKLAAIQPDDVVMDLGSGDGRIPIEAVRRYGARGGIGIDLDERLVALGTENAAKAGVGDRVRFVQGDLFKADLSGASIVTVYLLPNTVTQLVPKMLAEMKPGARVVAHDYPLVPWQHDRTMVFDLEEKIPISGSTRTVLYHYTVPARIGGIWTVALPPGLAARTARLEVRQDAAGATGTATFAGRTRTVSQVGVKGDAVRFEIPALGRGGAPLVLEGRVAGESMKGSVDQGAAGGQWSAARGAGS